MPTLLEASIRHGPAHLVRGSVASSGQGAGFNHQDDGAEGSSFFKEDSGEPSLSLIREDPIELSPPAVGPLNGKEGIGALDLGNDLMPPVALSAIRCSEPSSHVNH